MSINEVSAMIIRNSNEISLALSLLITVLFYKQYRVYEEQEKKEEMLEQFLSK